MTPAGTLSAFPAGQRPALADAAADGGWQCRALTGEDLPWLAALYASTREDEMRCLPWPAAALQQFLDQQFSAQHQHYLAQYPQAHYLAIEVDGQPAGRLYLDESGADDRVVDISLLPAWRGQGLGSAVLRRVQAAAAARGRAVALTVLAGNHGARQLYQRLGFSAGPAAPDTLYLPMRWCGDGSPAPVPD